MRAGSTKSESDGLLPLAALSLVVGAATGVVGAAFRFSLEWADRWRSEVLAQPLGPIGFAFVVAVSAVAAGVAAWLVRKFSPHAAGSGIPHVEAVLEGRLQPAPFVLIPVKFLGGVLAMGAGLALGREGPSVQIGSSLAHLSSRLLQRSWQDTRVLMAAGAGAGLAVAFNAPIAGAVFVLEELVRRFETRIAIAALGASATAMAVARTLLGDAPEFTVAALPYPNTQTRALFFALGLVTGIVGVVYNRALLGMIRGFKRTGNVPVEARAAIVGAGVALLGCFAPASIGGGEVLTQHTLDGKFTLGLVALMFAVRFVLGPVSYATRTPGGLFAPMLVIGAQLGLLFGVGCHQAMPELGMPAEAFAVVGMAAFFTAVVRAPITGITLITEMTGSFTMLLPMLAACFVAMIVPTMLGEAPIYDALREGGDEEK
jgi:CIC family chloride channel protein